MSSLLAGIVRILKNDSTTVGTGFVVSDEGLIATCAHVARLANAGPGDTVRLVFHLDKTKEEREASIDYWRDSGAEDVAILRLKGPLPQSVMPLSLGSSFGSEEHRFVTFGFPRAKSIEGMWGPCAVEGRVTENGFPVLQLTGEQISYGFSGAPIWDSVLQVVIGMVSSIIGGRIIRGLVDTEGEPITVPFDLAWRQMNVAYATPAETIYTICPALRISEECPYRGLIAFTEADAAIFFGRDQVVKSLMKKLRENPRSLVVFGPSGSGKSSIIQAGLLPKLRQENNLGSKNWAVISSRPASNPFIQLVEQGLAVESQDLVASIREWLKRHPEKTRLVLVVDQFEELFVTCPEPLRRKFIKQLIELRATAIPITVIVVMRDDFYDQFVQYPDLSDWLEQSGGPSNIPQVLKREDLIHIIQKPADRYRLRFQEALPDLIINDVVRESTPFSEEEQMAYCTVLPLLEFALTQLWEQRRQGVLTREAYRTIGGVTGGLTLWADQAISSLISKLGEERFRLVERIFLALVHLGDERRRHPDSRRPALLASLVSLCRNESEQRSLQMIIDELAKARLLVTSRDVQRDEEVVEIIHDALLTNWGELKRWIARDRRFLQWRQDLEQRVQAWIASGPEDVLRRDEGKLLRGNDLTEAEEMLDKRRDDLSSDQQEYILLSHQQMVNELERERQRTAQLREALETAQHQTRVAQSRELAAQAIANLSDFPQRSLLLAAAAIQVTERTGEARLPEAEDALRLALERVGGRRLEANLGAISYAAASPDNHWFCVVSIEGMVYLWNLDVPDPGSATFVLRHYKTPSIPIVARAAAVAFSSDGCWLAVAGYLDNSIRLWKLPPEDPSPNPFVLCSHKAPVTIVAISPNGHWLATGSGFDRIGREDNAVRLWDLTAPNGADAPIVLQGYGTALTQIMISSDNRWLATGSNSGTFDNQREGMVGLWDLTASHINQAPIISWRHDAPISTAVISPDCLWLVAGFGKSPLQEGVYQGPFAFLWDLSILHSNVAPVALFGHEHSVRGAFVSPDSQWLITIGGMNPETHRWDSIIHLWNLTDADPAHRSVPLGGHNGFIDTAVFSPDSRWLISCSQGSPPLLWNLTSRTLTIPLPLHGHESRSISAITLDQSHTGPLGNLRGGGYEQSISAVAFSSDSRWVITGGEDTTVRLWDLTAQDPSSVSTILRGHTERISFIAVSADNRWLITAGGTNQNTLHTDKTVCLWKLTDSGPLAEPVVLRGHEDSIECLAISSDSRWLVTVSQDRTQRLWRLTATDASAAPLVLCEYEESIATIAQSPDGRWLVAGGSKVYLWDLVLPPPIRAPVVLRGHSKSVNCVAVSPDGQWLATAAGWDTAVRLWRLTDLETAATMPFSLRGHTSYISDVIFDRNNRWLITASWDSTVRLWDITDPARGFPSLLLRLPDEGAQVLATSPDGRWLAIGSGGMFLKNDTIVTGGTIYLWEMNPSGATVGSIALRGHQGAIDDLVMSSDSRWLVSGSFDQTVRLWDLNARDPAENSLVLEGHETAVSHLAVSPDVHWLFTGAGPTGYLWDLSTTKPVTPRILRGHENEITSVAISPDSHWLVTASSDRTARVWDLTNTDPTVSVTLRGHKAKITAITISPDNHWIITAGEDGTVRLWTLWLPELMELACSTAGRNFTRIEWERYFPAQDYRRMCSNLPAAPDVVTALLQKGREYAKAGDREGAILQFQRARELNPDLDIEPDAEVQRSIAQKVIDTENNLTSTSYVSSEGFPLTLLAVVPPQTYIHPGDLFSISIPQNWIVADRSKLNKIEICFRDPIGDAQFVVWIDRTLEAVADPDDEKRLLQTTEEIFQGEVLLEFVGGLQPTGDSKATVLPFTFCKNRQGVQIPMRGLSLIRHDEPSTLLIASAPDHQWEALMQLFVGVINSYQTPPMTILTLQTYIHPDGLFWIDIPGSWRYDDQSTCGETRIFFRPPKRSAEIAVVIRKSTEQTNNEGEQLRQVIDAIFRDEEHFAFSGEPQPTSGGKSIMVSFTFDRITERGRTQMRGLGVVRRDAQFIGTLTIFVPDKQFSAYTHWFLEIVNSYQIDTTR